MLVTLPAASSLDALHRAAAQAATEVEVTSLAAIIDLTVPRHVPTHCQDLDCMACEGLRREWLDSIEVSLSREVSLDNGQKSDRFRTTMARSLAADLASLR